MLPVFLMRSRVAADAGIAAMAKQTTANTAIARPPSQCRWPREAANLSNCMIVLLSFDCASHGQTFPAGALGAAKRGAMKPQMIYATPSTSMPPITASMPEA